MNFRPGLATACLLAALTAGCGTVTASAPGGGAHSTASPVHPTASATAAKQSPAPSALNASAGAPSGCQRPAGGVLTLASDGKTYCVRVGEKFDVFLRGTVTRPWLEPLASSDVLVGVPNGAFSLVAGLTGASYAASRPGQVLITSIRRPCTAPLMGKNELQPYGPVPRVYPFRSCPLVDRFIVTVIVLR